MVLPIETACGLFRMVAPDQFSPAPNDGAAEKRHRNTQSFDQSRSGWYAAHRQHDPDQPKPCDRYPTRNHNSPRAGPKCGFVSIKCSGRFTTSIRSQSPAKRQGVASTVS